MDKIKQKGHLTASVEGMDREQLELGSSSKFWELITARRSQKTITRAELEEKLKHEPGHRGDTVTEPRFAEGV